MARKNCTPEESARREKIRELLQMANIDSMDDIQNLFSGSTVSRITDKILPVAREWQQRPLGIHLRRGISGCHPLPCPQRRSIQP